jgi:hypothetical protein
MKPSLVKEALKSCILSGVSTFIWGPPGVGKSDIVRQVAEEIGYGLRDVRASLLDPVDLRGLPSIVDGMTKWCPPVFLPTKGKHVVFLDELNAAPALVQAGCYQLVIPPHQLGEYTLPKGCAIIAAGNRETDRAITTRMSSALANRFEHIEFDVDLPDWIDWALANGVMTEMIAFMRFRPEMIHKFDSTKNDKAFPTPRSWTSVSAILAAKPVREIEYELVKGAVGEGAAAEFMGFLKIARELPDPDVVLMAPEKAEVPTSPASLYAICGALANKASEQTFNRICQYANRLPAEFSVLMIRDSIKKDKELQRTRAFIDWTAKHKSVLI